MASDSLQALTSGDAAQAFIDHMGGAAFARDYVETEDTWLNTMTRLAQYLSQNVAYYVNAGSVDSLESQKRKMISADGFPSYMTVNNTYISPGGYTAWSSTENRDIKQVVLHSFGHQWHAFKSDNKWFGIMNVPGKATLYVPDDEAGTKVFWVPKGTDPGRGMEHKGRLAAALNACMFPTPGSAAAHFIISRSGDLFVLADCNDVLNSSQDLSTTAISIALEEALYLEAPVGGFRPVATWLPSGSPPGTDGTLKYWDYSEQQYLTLAVLLKKLQTAYPSLSVRTHTTSAGEATSSFVGYTMHSHIQGADPRYIDVSPHLQTAEDWTALFDLVDKQEQVTATSVWVPRGNGYLSRLSWVEGLFDTLQNLGGSGLAQKMMTSPAIVSMLGVLRSHREFQKDNRAYRQAAARTSALASSSYKVKAGVEQTLDFAAKAPLSLPALELGDSLVSACEWDLDSEG